MTKIKHNIRTKRTLQTPIIICSSDEFFLLETNTVVVLVRVLIKPAINVQVVGGFDASETLLLSFCRDWRFSRSDKSEFCKTLSLKENWASDVSFSFPTISSLSLLEPLSKSTKLSTVEDIQADWFSLISLCMEVSLSN